MEYADFLKIRGGQNPTISLLKLFQKESFFESSCIATHGVLKTTDWLMNPVGFFGRPVNRVQELVLEFGVL